MFGHSWLIQSLEIEILQKKPFKNLPQVHPAKIVAKLLLSKYKKLKKTPSHAELLLFHVGFFLLLKAAAGYTGESYDAGYGRRHTTILYSSYVV